LHLTRFLSTCTYSHFCSKAQRNTWVNFLIQVICCHAMEPFLIVTIWKWKYLVTLFFLLCNKHSLFNERKNGLDFFLEKGNHNQHSILSWEGQPFAWYFLPILFFYIDQINDITWFQKRRREASKELVLHQTVKAVVEIVKENYMASIGVIILHHWLFSDKTCSCIVMYFTEFILCKAGCINSRKWSCDRICIYIGL